MASYDRKKHGLTRSKSAFAPIFNILRDSPNSMSNYGFYDLEGKFRRCVKMCILCYIFH